MDPNLDSISAFQRLTASPSESEWERELHALLHGRRASVLDRLGGPEEYVEVILAETPDQAAGDVAFRRALRHVVEEWQPDRPGPAHYASYLIRLISAYTPTSGFRKLAGAMKDGIRFQEADAPIDIHRKALLALRNYFPVPDVEPPRPPTASSVPPGDARTVATPAFQTYIQILTDHLRNTRYCGYAAAQLVDLNYLSWESSEIDDVVRRHPAAVLDFVALVLKPERAPLAAHDLSELYALVLRTKDPKVETEFHKALEFHNANLVDRPDALVVAFQPESHYPSRDTIALTLSIDVRDQHFEQRWRRFDSLLPG